LGFEDPRVVDLCKVRCTVSVVRYQAALVLAATLLVGCSSGSSAPEATTAKPSKPQPTAPIVTITPGEKLPPGTAVVVQELPDACAEAVKDLRKLMQEYDSGFVLDEAGSDRMNKGLGAGHSSCEQPDWDRFYSFEFRGWLAPAEKSEKAEK
jgi:hypothetical protein